MLGLAVLGLEHVLVVGGQRGLAAASAPVYSAFGYPKTSASWSWPPSALVWRVPEQPSAEVSGWPWLSRPRMKVTFTLAQSMAAVLGVGRPSP